MASDAQINGLLGDIEKAINHAVKKDDPSLLKDVKAVEKAFNTLVADIENMCFVSGTSIRTTRGDVAVEALTAGDRAITADGSERAIRWIGKRDIECAELAEPSTSWPVRIRAGAFGAGLPKRDLYLSPGHPVLVGRGGDEVLVPVMCLINGTSIARVSVDTVTYWHVELDAHDLLLAEGLPAESFLDYGNRGWFEKGGDHDLLHPDWVAPGLEGRCRPVALDGPVVEAERRRLDMVFAAGLTAQCRWPSEEGVAAA